MQSAEPKTKNILNISKAPIALEESRNIRRKLKNRKAHGADDIPAKLVKYLAKDDGALSILCNLLNA